MPLDFGDYVCPLIDPVAVLPIRFELARRDRVQALDDRQHSHHRDVGEREQALEPLGGHRLAADAEKFDFACRLLSERPHQLEAELVAGWLAGDEGDAQATRSGAHGA